MIEIKYSIIKDEFVFYLTGYCLEIAEYVQTITGYKLEINEGYYRQCQMGGEWDERSSTK